MFRTNSSGKHGHPGNTSQLSFRLDMTMLQIVDVAKELKKGIVATRNGVAIYSEDKNLMDYFSCSLDEYVLRYVNCDEIKVQTFILKEKHDAVIVIGDLEYTEDECLILSDLCKRLGIKTDRETIFSIVCIDPNDKPKKNLFSNNVFSDFSQSVTNQCSYRTPSKNLVILEQNKHRFAQIRFPRSTLITFSACIIVFDIFYMISPFRDPNIVFAPAAIILSVFSLVSFIMIRNGNFRAIHMYRITSNQAIRIMLIAIIMMVVLQYTIPIMLHVTQLVGHW